MSNLACDVGSKLLDGYLEETLEGGQRAEFERHLLACPTCAGEVRAYRRTVDFLSHVALPDMPEELWRRQRGAIARGIRPSPVWAAPTFSLVGLAAVVAGYVWAGMDWLYVSFGDFLGQPSGPGPASSPTSFDGFDTVILIYLGLFSMALMAFLSDREEETRRAPARAGARRRQG